MSLIIGLTGSIASGKSTVSTMLAELEMPVIDADKIAREVVEPGKPAYYKIIETFGEGILNVDQTLNRKKLGSIVFSNEDKLKQLNQIVHPAIRNEMDKQKKAYIQAGEKSVVLDIPLLYENQLTDFVDQVIVVYVDENIQIKRLMARDHFTEQEAKQRITSQMSLQAKAQKADAVINNNGTKKQTREQLIEILEKWQAK